MLRLLIENTLDRRISMRTVKLREISELKTGPFGTQFSASEYVLEGTPVINVKNIGYGDIITAGLDYVGISTVERLAEHKLREGDIVFGRKGSVDRHCLITKGQDGWMQGSDCIRVRITDSFVLPDFVSYYLLTDAVKAKINNSAVGSTMASLNTDILGDIEINLPSHDEQSKIAATLSAIDRKIRNNNSINDYLEEMAKTIYDYWFVQFDFPDNCGMPYKSSGGFMVVTDGNKTIPKDWESLSIGNICTLKNGINYEKDIEGDKVYTIVNVRDITASSLFINNSSCDRISLPSSLANKYLISNDSILIARSGTPGAVRLVEGNDDNNIIYCGFIIAATPLDSCYRNYLAFTLKKYEGSNATQTGGSILKNVSQDTLYALTISYPPSDVIENFNSAIKPILHQIAINSDEINMLIQLRDWLLPMLMNGQATIED